MENVYKEYPNGYRALENVNLNVAEGEFITLIGHSGCGKSTLLNMVSGFSHPSQGTCRLTGSGLRSRARSHGGVSGLRFAALADGV